MGVGIGALGVGVGYGLYKLLAGRAGYSDLEKTATRVRDEMIAKEERLAATTDPEIRAAIFEDYQREGRALVDVLLPKMAEIAGRDILELATIFVSGGIAMYFAFRGLAHIAKVLKEARLLKPVLQPTPNDAVLLGCMPDQLYAIGMTPEDLGLTAMEIIQAQQILGVVPPPLYVVTDTQAIQIASCMAAYMAGAATGAIAGISITTIAGATFTAVATGWTAANVAIVATAATATGITLVTVLQSLGWLKLFFGC